MKLLDDAIESVQAIKDKAADSNFIKQATKHTGESLNKAIEHGKKVPKGLWEFANKVKGLGPVAAGIGVAKGLMSGDAAEAAEGAASLVPGVRHASDVINPSKAGGGFEGNEEGELVKSIDNRPKKKAISGPKINKYEGNAFGDSDEQYGTGRNPRMKK